MYLKSLELSGFKSFAKKASLDFKAKTTAIVGPNGSGKSNLAEAFRFVLGEQSMKSLRSKRGEDLIWNGSDEAPRANRAFVKAVFDNSKKVFNIDFDEVSIERAVNRDGTNEYLINGSQVRLKDVLELLAEANIGASGHHIISQGEADRILSSNIKERKSMIEDALGLKVYQYKREESERKLLKTNENINQVESLRREIAPHLKFLRRQMEKFSKAEEVKGKLAELYKEYLKRESLYVSENKKKIKEEKDVLLKQKEQFEREMERATKTLNSSKNKDDKSEKLLHIEEEIKQTRNKKGTLERDLGKVEGEINANANIVSRELEKEEREDRKVSLKEFEKLSEEIDRESDIQAIKQKIRSFIEENRRVQQNSIVEQLKIKNEELEEKKRKIEEGIKKLEENLTELDQKYKEIRQEIEAEKDSNREAEREIFRISSLESQINSEINLLKVREESLKVVEEDLQREMREAAVLMGNLILGFEELELKDEERKAQEERRREVEKMKIRLEEFGAAESGEVTKEFNDANERDQFLEKELNDLKISSESLNKIIEELEKKLDVEFKEGIEKINESFSNYFALMFGGGTAKLEVVEQKKSPSLEEEESFGEPKEDGIDINVSLPKKRIKGLVMLSGGERALTSIALLFAISQVNPPPFIILDETDAALDEANSKKYGDMIESLSKYSQLILITHNRETMSRAGVIYGVTMAGSGVSKLLSIQFDEAVVVAK